MVDIRNYADFNKMNKLVKNFGILFLLINGSVFNIAFNYAKI